MPLSLAVMIALVNLLLKVNKIINVEGFMYDFLLSYRVCCPFIFIFFEVSIVFETFCVCAD